MTTPPSSQTSSAATNAGRASSVAFASLLGLALIGGTAAAYWTAPGSGSGSAETGSVAAPDNVQVAAPAGSSSRLHITWVKPAVGFKPSAYRVTLKASQVSGIAAEQVVCDADSATTSAAYTEPTPGSFSCTDFELSPGVPYTYEVTSLAGSKSASASGSSSTNAQAVFNISQPGENATNISRTPTITGTTDTAGSVALEIRNKATNARVSPAPSAVAATAGTPWSVSTTTTLAYDTEYTVVATLTKSASGETVSTQSRTFRTVPQAAGDGAAPTQQVTVPAADGFLAPGTAVTVTGTASDPSGVASLRLQMSSDGGATYANVGTTGNASASATATATYNWTVPSSGTIKFRTTATDGATPANTGQSTERVMTVGVAAILVEAPASFTAGTAQNVTLTAKNATGATNTTYDGAHTVTWGGAAFVASPNGTAPSTAVASFTNGVATVPVTLPKAGSGTLTASTADYSAGSDDVTVVAAAPTALAFVDCSEPTNTNSSCAGPVVVGNNNSMTAGVELRDAHGNAAKTETSRTITISRTSTNSYFTHSPSSVTVAADGTKSGTVTFSTGSGQNLTTGTFEAASAGLSSVSLDVKR